MSKDRGVFERRPSVWYARYTDANGKDRWKKAGRKSTAILLYDKLKAKTLRDKLLPELVEKDVPTFGELAADCLVWSKAHKRSWKQDQYRMRRIYDKFGKLRADHVTVEAIDQLKGEMKAAGLSNCAVNRTLALISLTYRLGIEKGKVTDNPIRRVKKFKEPTSRTKFLSEADEAVLRSTIKAKWPRHIPEIDIAIHTGIRQGEQYKLTWNCVDFERAVITLPLTKNGETRHVHLNSVALEALKELFANRKGRERVFKIKCPKEWFKVAVKDSKLEDFRWHDLRHTFASRLVMAGVPLPAVKELLGHKTISMTMRYAHLAPDYQKDCVEKLVAADVAKKK